MTVNPLPPQAYTKETLQKAYAWLLNQGPSVKDMATSQDILVSMYLKAQRSGDASLETPSIQNFKQELKSLASLMGDLQGTPNTNNASKATQATHTNSHVAQSTAQTTPIVQQQQQSTYATVSASPANAANLISQLDAQSLLAIQELKQNLNLSSDTEALRALIALGYKHFKKIY